MSKNKIYQITKNINLHKKFKKYPKKVEKQWKMRYNKI